MICLDQGRTEQFHVRPCRHRCWRPRQSKGELCDIGKGKSRCRNGPFWAAVSASLAAFAGGYSDGPRFRPPEGSFVNFFAKMANTVLRSRRAKVVPLTCTLHDCAVARSHRYGRHYSVYLSTNTPPMWRFLIRKRHIGRGKTPFGKTPFGKTPFGKTLFGKTPFGKSALQKR